jgi:Dictyostelium (slime mold) repeat
MSRRTIRCSSPALVAVAVLLLGATTAQAQHTTGFNMTKTCPTVVASGESFQCTVTLANNDVDHGVINLVVTNQVPFPGGPTTTLDCRQPFDPTDCTAGVVVTTLGPAGSLTAACGSCIPETAPINCSASNVSFVDEVRAVGTDAAEPPSPFVGLPVSSSTTNATPVAPLVCGDNNACTTDTCDPATGCVNTPISCADNNACTADSCNPATGCVVTPIVCNDNNACTTDTCDPATGCVATPIVCNDNNACTTDTCDPATGCVATPIVCNDNNACTTDTCDPATGCVATPITCNDNNACTTDTCDPATGCVATPITCNDNNACTQDTCDPATGCVTTPITCNDNNACTQDTCDPATGCLNVPITCNDNNACTTDTCDPATGCVATPITCNDNNACTTDTCDPATGCVTTAVSCDDNNPCTDDSCDPATGCVHTDNGTCVSGRMTGGGSVFGKGTQRVTHGFELHCDPEVGPNNLEVNWAGNHFHMEELLTATCSDDPNIEPPPPQAGFDTYVGTGTGRCNGVAGATISFTFTDAGEPGTQDIATFEITGCPDIGGISVSGPLKKGNHQAHAN